MNFNLSEGALQRIFGGEMIDKPVVQIISYKKVPGGQDRYRMLLSDGQNCHPFSMLATQLNDRLANKEFERFTIVRLDKYSCTEMQPGRKIIIMLDLSVVFSGEVVGRKIGNPQQLGANTDSSNQNVLPNQNVRSRANGHHEAPNDLPGTTVKQEPSSGSSENSGTRPDQSFYSATVKSEPRFNPIIPLANSHKSSTSNGLSSDSPPFGPIISISNISPYQNSWSIKARVTAKTPIKTWSNSKGEGKLFSMDLLDESGEIRVTVFTDLVDKFYNTMEINKVYFITKGYVKAANKKFTHIRHDYELTFNNESQVIECNETTSSIPTIKYDFKDIASLKDIDPSAQFTTVDVIGVCKSVGDLNTIITRTTNKELKKRDLQLVDKSLNEINLTIWGETAENFDSSSNPIIAVKGARLSDFNGRSLSTLMSTVMVCNPDIREAHALRGWYDREGANAATQSVTKAGGMSGPNASWKTFAQAHAEKLGFGDKPDFFNAKAMIVLIKKDNCMYQACPSDNCNKKVQDLQDGNYRCEKCGKDYPDFQWRLLVNVNLCDFSDGLWATSFQETSEIILGHSAGDLGRMKQTDDNALTETISNAQFKSYIFKIRAKAEVYNEEQKVKFGVVNVTAMDYVEYGEKLLQDVQNYESLQ